MKLKSGNQQRISTKSKSGSLKRTIKSISQQVNRILKKKEGQKLLVPEMKEGTSL